MLNHYITIYGRNGKKYAASWIQLNIFGRCFCFSKREKEIMINNEDWIPVNKKLPAEGQEVLVTIEMDNSYGHGTEIDQVVDLAYFNKYKGYIKSDSNNGFFDTTNDWDEGQPISVIAWAQKPIPYCEIK